MGESRRSTGWERVSQGISGFLGRFSRAEKQSDEDAEGDAWAKQVQAEEALLEDEAQAAAAASSSQQAQKPAAASRARRHKAVGVGRSSSKCGDAVFGAPQGQSEPSQQQSGRRRQSVVEQVMDAVFGGPKRAPPRSRSRWRCPMASTRATALLLRLRTGATLTSWYLLAVQEAA